jgi:phosphoribosylamine---glycine ligase
VIVCQTMAEAEQAVESMLGAHAFGAAGDTILVEEFMEGEELSLFALTDGTRAIALVPAQDHKRLLEGDRGPNTGGMGAYAPVSVAGGLIDTVSDSPLVDDAMESVVLPTLAAMRAEGRPFTGLLYAGLMLTTDGPRVIEFNARFGDPETEAVLPIMDASPSLLDMMHLVSSGEPLPGDAVVRPRGCAVTTIVASHGYPESPRTGDVISLPSDREGVIVFHAGTKRRDDGMLVTAGGRVFAVTGMASSIAEAQRRSLEMASSIDFSGKQLRTDIGWRELARHAGAA